MTDAPPLAADFPAADPAVWRSLVDKALNGAPFDRLITATYDGVAIRPLYTEADWPSAATAFGAPEAASLLHDQAAPKARHGAWLIRQIVSRPDPAAANKEILADLEGGVSSIELKLDRGDGRGLGIRASADIDIALEGVMVDLAPWALDPGSNAASAALFADWAEARNLKQAHFAFNLDPLAATLAYAEADFETAIAFAKRARAVFSNATALRIDARPAHEAGASEGQELGYALANAAALLRAGETAGLGPEDVAKACLVTFATGADLHMEIAKLRAARRLLARLLEACGVSPGQRRMLIQAVTAKRMMTRRDPWVNLIRGTAAGFACGVGGADIVTVLPASEALGQPTPFTRRVARNTQILLQEESNLGRVADPASGSWALERLTDDLATAGWAFFQDIERHGGAVAALESGWLAAAIGAVAAKRIKNIRIRKDAVTGVSEFASLGETAVTTEPWHTALPPPASRLPELRLAAPFEDLRDAAESAGEPPIFLATIGALAEFSARALFAKALFEAGGVSARGAEDAHADDDAAVFAFKASGARLACLCASDARYGERGAALAAALKAAGAARVYLAGRGGENEGKLRAAGVDEFIYAGCDVVAVLEGAHKALGIA